MKVLSRIDVVDEPRLDENLDPNSQDSIAKRFATRYADRVRYCGDAGPWFSWTGSHWARDKNDYVFQLIRFLTREASSPIHVPGFKSMRKAPFILGVERLVRGDLAVNVSLAEFDKDPFLIGTPAGTVNLRNGELRAASPSDNITKLTLTGPASKADCPTWKEFLRDATGEDVEMVRLLQQWCGYCLTGDTSEHAMLFVYGPGGNGKSVFMNLIHRILGDYATIAPMEAFTASSGEKHPAELALLHGARLVSASETEDGKAWAESRLKQITGGDPITARFLYQNHFTFRPEFKLMIAGNYQPSLPNVSDATKRRLRIVPFTRTPINPDPQLESKLMSEAPAILRWMIEGCLDWQESRLLFPSSVLSATSQYFEEQDLFGHWLDEMCEVDPENDHLRATAAELYESWTKFARAAGEDAGSSKKFTGAMQRKGLSRWRTSTTRGFQGVKLKRTVQYGMDDDR